MNRRFVLAALPLIFLLTAATPPKKPAVPPAPTVMFLVPVIVWLA